MRIRGTVFERDIIFGEDGEQYSIFCISTNGGTLDLDDVFSEFRGKTIVLTIKEEEKDEC